MSALLFAVMIAATAAASSIALFAVELTRFARALYKSVTSAVTELRRSADAAERAARQLERPPSDPPPPREIRGFLGHEDDPP